MTSEHVRVYESTNHFGINVMGSCRDEGVSPILAASSCLLEAVTEGNSASSYAQSLSLKDLIDMS